MTSEKAALVFPKLAQDDRSNKPRWSAPGRVGLWLRAVLPMAGLSLWLAPILIARYPALNLGLVFWGTIIAGMIWLAKVFAFGRYPGHKATVWPMNVISGVAYDLPPQYLRSIWPALLIHGVEGVILIAAVLFVVLGGMQ